MSYACAHNSNAYALMRMRTCTALCLDAHAAHVRTPLQQVALGDARIPCHQAPLDETKGSSLALFPESPQRCKSCCGLNSRLQRPRQHSPHSPALVGVLVGRVPARAGVSNGDNDSLSLLAGTSSVHGLAKAVLQVAVLAAGDLIAAAAGASIVRGLHASSNETERWHG